MFKDLVGIHYTIIEAIKLGHKPIHLERISKIQKYANIENFEGINFQATLHDIGTLKKLTLIK